MPNRLSVILFALAVCACGGAAEKPPLPEALVVVDTNLPAPLVAARLRVDLYDENGTWFDSTDFGRPDDRDWPASFSVYSQDEAREQSVYVRLRAYPEGGVDTYLGERFRDLRDPFAEPPETNAPRLLRDGRDVTPRIEPSPLLAVDRLVHVPLRPGTRGRVRVLLHGACVGTMVDMGPAGLPSPAARSCIDRPKERAPIAMSALEEDMSRPTTTAVGTWLRGRCPPRAEGETRICVPGGATLLGSRENSDYTPGSTAQLDSAPPRVFGLSPFYVDVDELTVGALRELLAAGYTGPLPLANDGPIAEFSAGNPAALCTWSLDATGRDDYPITCASYRAARAICKYRGGDILTEAQWEHVATIAGHGRKVRYPWGQDPPTCDRAVYGRVPLGPIPAPCPIGNGPRRIVESANDVTPLGIRGLYGSVTEWVIDDAVPYASPEWAAASIVDPRVGGGEEARRVWRGQSWKAEAFRPIFRYIPTQEDGFGPMGVRCAYPTVVQR